LAHLAARLDSDLCKREPQAAFLNALAFYQLAAQFVEAHADQNVVELYADSTSTVPILQNAPLMQMLIKKALPSFAEWEREQIEVKKLRFYPKRPSDEVRELLKVTTARRVKDLLKRQFVAEAEKIGLSEDEGLKKFKEFWEPALRKDEHGEEYCVIRRDTLDAIKSNKDIRNKNRSEKAAQTRSQNRSKS
jgi:hypothetical protein